MKKKNTFRIDGKTFVKSDFKGEVVKEKIIDAALKGDLDAYIVHPLTKKAIKVPSELINKMKGGETVTLSDIENYQVID